MRFKKVALRSYSAGGFHRNSAQFIRQSEHYNIGTLQQTVRHRYKWRTARHYRRCRLQRKARSSQQMALHCLNCRPPQQCDRPNPVRVFQFGTLDAI
jgi:hypothetical protein